MRQVIYATIFGRSTLGAAFPDGQTIDGHALPRAGTLLNAEYAASLQRIADAVVLGPDGRRRVAWGG